MCEKMYHKLESPNVLSCSFVSEWIFFERWQFCFLCWTAAYFNHSCVVSCLRFGFTWRPGFWGRDRKHISEDGAVGLELRHLARMKIGSDWDWDLMGNIWWSFTFCDCSAVIDFSLDRSQWWCYHRGQAWEWDLIQHSLLVGSTQWQAMHPDFYCANFSLNKNFMWRTISNVSNFIADTSSHVKMKDTRWHRKSVRKIT